LIGVEMFLSGLRTPEAQLAHQAAEKQQEEENKRNAHLWERDPV